MILLDAIFSSAFYSILINFPKEQPERVTDVVWVENDFQTPKISAEIYSILMNFPKELQVRVTDNVWVENDLRRRKNEAVEKIAHDTHENLAVARSLAQISNEGLSPFHGIALLYVTILH